MLYVSNGSPTALVSCIIHLLVATKNLQEDELAKSIDSCRAEVGVLSTWINFLEDTWSLHCSYVETKEKEAKYVYELQVICCVKGNLISCLC